MIYVMTVPLLPSNLSNVADSGRILNLFDRQLMKGAAVQIHKITYLCSQF